MEEKNVIKINLSTFFLIIAIIVIIVMSIVVYKLYNEKTTEAEKNADLQTQINSLNGESSDLQEKDENSDNSVSTNTTTNLEKIEGTFYPEDYGAGDSSKLIFYLDGTVESAGNGIMSGTYTIKDNIITIKYTRYVLIDEDEEVNYDYQLTIIDENTLMLEIEEDQSQYYYIKSDVDIDIVGEWNCTNATNADNEEVSFREIFGSIISNGIGELTFNIDGTFTDYIGVFSSEFDDDTTGTYTVSGDTIILNSKSGKTKTLTYYVDDLIIYYPYDDYIIILEK